jgi:predicted MFS family arabinose efflux permease
VFQSRALWLAVAFIFLKELSPGFGTPLFYYQTDTLHFTSQFLGALGAVYNGAAIVGALGYGWLCARLPLGRLLAAGIVLSAASSLLFLGYRSPLSAVVIQAASGLLGIIISVALMDLAARATPRGGEAMAYSLLMSAFNLGLTGSDILGARLYDRHYVGLPALIGLSAATTALTLLAVPLIPREILARPDRAGRTP